MKLFKSRPKWMDLIVWGLLIFALARRAPEWIHLFKVQGSQSQTKSIVMLDGKQVQLPMAQPHVLIFWATWCGPCTLELGRIQKSITAGDIDPTRVVAISIAEPEQLVRDYANKRGYTFHVSADPQGQFAGAYGVVSTPTILLINSDGKIEWMSSGISPTLTFRISKFLSIKDR